jgi:hypothetical protein
LLPSFPDRDLHRGRPDLGQMCPCLGSKFALGCLSIFWSPLKICFEIRFNLQTKQTNTKQKRKKTEHFCSLLGCTALARRRSRSSWRSRPIFTRRSPRAKRWPRCTPCCPVACRASRWSSPTSSKSGTGPNLF